MVSILKNKLYRNSGIEIRKSPKHGWGVFSRTNIKKYSLLEEVPFLLIPESDIASQSDLRAYTYTNEDEQTQFIIGFGLAQLYNHSSDPNADWTCDWVNMTISFYASKNIFTDEEICIHYGLSLIHI